MVNKLYKILPPLLFFILQFILPVKTFAQSTPVVVNLKAQNTSVPKFSKFETTFTISKSFTPDSLLPYYYYDASDTPANDPGRNSPYGVDGITIDAVFTSPSGKTIRVPAFYYQDYTRGGSYSSGATMTPTNNYMWKVRFAPSETGTYTYYISIQDKNGTTRYPTTGFLNMNSTESNAKGFIRVSTIDPRYMQFDNGETFVPIASGRQWWECCGIRSWDYENTFNEWGSKGINFTRIWDQNDGYNLTVEGRYDGYSWPEDTNPIDRGVNIDSLPKGTQMNQRGNYEEDKIIEAAERNGVYITLSSHGDAYWIWDGATYDESWNNTQQRFDSVRHINYWKRNFRYRVARWGYSTSIHSWETWNEHGHVLPNTEVYNFYKAYSEFQKNTDPYKHLRTTSQGSQAFSPAFWSSGFFDVANYHNYMMDWVPSNMRTDASRFVYNTGWCLSDSAFNNNSPFCNNLGLGDGTNWVKSKGYMPWIWGEFDVGTNVWDQVNPKVRTGEGRIRMLHNSMWAGLFSPIATNPIDWYYDFEDAATTQARYSSKKIASDFFKNINIANLQPTNLMDQGEAPAGYSGETLVVTNNNLRSYALRSKDKDSIYLWVQNKGHTWNTAPAVPSPVSANITIPNVNNKNYKIDIIDTYTGSIIKSSSVQAVNNSLTVPVSNISKDVAMKVVADGTIVNPTPTPIPVPTPTPTTVPSTTVTPTPMPTTSLGNGDVNADGTTNQGDISALISNWYRTPNISTDQYPDNIINSLDYAVVLSNIPVATPTQTPTPTSTPTITPTPTPTNTPSPTPTTVPTPVPTVIPTPTPNPAPVSSNTWNQHGANAQRTSYVEQEAPTPWTWNWAWNGPNSSGGIVSGKFELPRNTQVITGDSKLYIAAGTRGLIALSAGNGSQVWTFTQATINSTPAYDNGFVYTLGTNGILYKLNSTNGSVDRTFNLGTSSTLPLPPAISGNQVFVGMGNYVYSLDKNSLSQNWRYDTGGSLVNTPVSFSAVRNTAVVVTQDLYVHAIDSTGSRKWRQKPTPRVYGNPQGDATNNLAEATFGWPVIAEGHGYVIVKYRLDWNTLWQLGRWPTDNVQIRNNLVNNPGQQAMFVMNLDNGSVPFVSNIGHGGWGDGGYMPMGPQPVVKRLGDGNEVVYMVVRGDNRYDARGDSQLGEMVLDNNTVPGLQAGYIRWIEYCNYGWSEYSNSNCFVQPTDEQPNLSMAGNQLMAAHWALGFGVNIRNRSNSYGIDTIAMPSMATVTTSSQVGSFSPTHYSSQPFDLNTTEGENRNLPPGFYIYYNQGKVYDRYWSGYSAWTISDGKVYFLSNEGTVVSLRSNN